MPYIPPPAPVRVLHRAAHAVLGAVMLGGLIAAIWLAVHLIAAIFAGAA